MDIILLIFRLIVGLGIAAQGVEKLFGPLADSRFTRTIALGEFAGGLLLALGLMNPIGAALMVSLIVINIFTMRWFTMHFAANDESELPILYIASALVIAFGPGRYSLDHMLGLSLAIPRAALWVVLAVGGLGALGNLAHRRAPGPPARPSAITPNALAEIFEETAIRFDHRYCWLVEFHGRIEADRSGKANLWIEVK